MPDSWLILRSKRSDEKDSRKTETRNEPFNFVQRYGQMLTNHNGVGKRYMIYVERDGGDGCIFEREKIRDSLCLTGDDINLF